MDKEFKKVIKKILWLDTILESSDSLWGILDEIEDELEDMFGKERKSIRKIEDFFKINKEDE